MRRYIAAAATLLSCFGCTNESIVVGPNGPATMTVRSVVPTNGSAGDFVTIHGVNFSGLGAPFSVSFNGAVAWLEDYSDSVLTVRVPPDATTGPLRVLAPNDSATVPYSRSCLRVERTHA